MNDISTFIQLFSSTETQEFLILVRVVECLNPNYIRWSSFPLKFRFFDIFEEKSKLLFCLTKIRNSKGFQRQLFLIEIAGLVELPFAVQFNGIVQPARLPKHCPELNEGEIVTAAGNGRTEMNTRTANFLLRQGNLEVLPPDECAFVATLEDIEDIDWIICTLPRNNQSTYVGDSGEKIFKPNTGRKSPEYL